MRGRLTIERGLDAGLRGVAPDQLPKRFTGEVVLGSFRKLYDLPTIGGADFINQLV